MKITPAEVLMSILAVMISVAPVSAYAHGHGHGGHHWGIVGPVGAIFALGAAVVEGTAAVLTAPFAAAAAISQPPAPYYQPAPRVIYAPPAPAYYSPPPPAYYPPPPPYYPPAPGYYYPYLPR